MMMTTTATAKKGVDVTKLGIGACSFNSGYRDGRDHEVSAGDGHDLHHASRRYLGIGGGGHVVGSAGKADENGAEMVGGDADRDTSGGTDHVIQAEGVARLGLPEHLESAK